MAEIFNARWRPVPNSARHETRGYRYDKAQDIGDGIPFRVYRRRAGGGRLGSYDYVGQPIDCVGVQSSCTVKVAVPGHFTASMTLPIDFNHTLTGDQTFYAFAFNVHGITDWSISDGTHVLGSITGDLLDPNSYLTYNNGVIRTWGIAASNPSGSIFFNIAPHADYTTINGATAIGRSLGVWTNGAGGVAQGAVPEPASWALLLAGFGTIGAAARRRRVQPMAAV